MEELRSATPGRPVYGKGKLLRNSNVTVIQMMASERMNRRADKEIRRRAEASDLEVITVMPVTNGEAGNNSLLKLHILNVRTGKIQDAIISSDEREFFKPQPFHKKSLAIKSRNVNGRNEIVRIQQHSSEPETTFNEININKKFAQKLKPYKMRNKFTSSKCKCEDTSRMWNCKKIQISIARCRSDQFLCCSGY